MKLGYIATAIVGVASARYDLVEFAKSPDAKCMICRTAMSVLNP